jgi:hypothetical protein
MRPGPALGARRAAGGCPGDRKPWGRGVAQVCVAPSSRASPDPGVTRGVVGRKRTVTGHEGAREKASRGRSKKQPSAFYHNLSEAPPARRGRSWRSRPGAPRSERCAGRGGGVEDVICGAAWAPVVYISSRRLWPRGDGAGRHNRRLGGPAAAARGPGAPRGRHRAGRARRAAAGPVCRAAGGGGGAPTPSADRFPATRAGANPTAQPQSCPAPPRPAPPPAARLEAAGPPAR